MVIKSMGKYNLEYDVLNELADEFSRMDETMKARIKKTATQIGQQLKRNTEKFIPRQTEPKHGTHLADDVVMSVKETDKKASITVKGGSKTGALWFIVDNGHVAKNGKFVAGAHFTDKAYNATDVESPVDSLIQEILNE